MCTLQWTLTLVWGTDKEAGRRDFYFSGEESIYQSGFSLPWSLGFHEVLILIISSWAVEGWKAFQWSSSDKNRRQTKWPFWHLCKMSWLGRKVFCSKLLLILASSASHISWVVKRLDIQKEKPLILVFASWWGSASHHEQLCELAEQKTDFIWGEKRDFISRTTASSSKLQQSASL